jgi:hypothetical protein
LRELVAIGSGPTSPTTSLSEAEKEKQEELQHQQHQFHAPKPKRHRRTKAEIAAAKAAAAAENATEEGVASSTPRRKRKRADNGNNNGTGDGENGDDASGVIDSTPKRRRRGNAANEVTSNYGTRSRSNANAKPISNSNRNSQNSILNKDEEAGSPLPTNAPPSTRGRSASTTRSVSTIDGDEPQETNNNATASPTVVHQTSVDQLPIQPDTEGTLDQGNDNDVTGGAKMEVVA